MPEDADLVIIPGPTKDLTGDLLAWLWAYLQRGGRLLLLADPVVKPFEGFKASAGLFQLMWDAMGLRVCDDVVVAQGAPIMAMAPQPESPPIAGGVLRGAVNHVPTGSEKTTKRSATS